MACVVEGAREGGNRVGSRAVDHRREIGEERAVGQFIACGVLAQQRDVGLEHPHELHAGIPQGRLQKARDMPVHEPGDRESEGRGFLRARRRERSQVKRRRADDDSHAEDLRTRWYRRRRSLGPRFQ